MEHLASILWLVSLPVLIYASYLVSLFALKIFNKNNQETEV
jgi:hypothetical protein